MQVFNRHGTGAVATKITSLDEAKAVREYLKARDEAVGNGGKFTYRIRARGKRATSAAAHWLNVHHSKRMLARGYQHTPAEAGRQFQSYLPQELGEYFAIYRHPNSAARDRAIEKFKKAFVEATGREPSFRELGPVYDAWR